jgi:hypothetical protein
MNFQAGFDGYDPAIAVPRRAGYGLRGHGIAPRDADVRSHQEFARVLRRAGYRNEFISEVLGQLPDPIDLQRDQPVLGRYLLNSERLMDRLGASP